MEAVSKWIVRHKAAIIIIYTIMMAISAVTSGMVKINYNLSDYLPDTAPSTIALDIMNEQYTTEPDNLRIMLDDASLIEALEIKKRIATVPGVRSISCLDDAVDITTPRMLIEQKTLDTWMRDGHVLLTAYINDSEARAALAQIREIVGDSAAMDGEIVQSTQTQIGTAADVRKIFLIAVPLILLILLLTTRSWFEPVLFLAAIGVSIMLNMGTNIILGEISFITNTCAMILQLAVSMDYAIFLLDCFGEYRLKGEPIEAAMQHAIQSSFMSICSSALTTILGFLALTLMKFRVGYDLGLVLAKGVLISLFCVMTLLPVLASLTSGLIERTQHKSLMPTLKHTGKLVSRVCIPCCLIIVVVVVPCYLAQNNISFIYGGSDMITDPDAQVVIDKQRIEDVFGKSNQMVIMVPTGNLARERQLYDELYDLPEITSITAYVGMADETIPISYVGRSAVSALISGEYSRMVLSAATDAESVEAFALVERIREIAQYIFPDEYQLTGGTVNTYDLRDTVLSDNVVVNLFSIAAIALTVMLAFKSLMVPIVLVSTIEASIWINLSRLYFMGNELYYIALLIINAVQLGATVDYAILFANHYIDNRKTKPRLQAVASTISETVLSVLTSASIMCIAGMLLSDISTVTIVAQIGDLVGYGAGISAVLVAIMLPGLLMIFDPIIEHTTLKLRFYHKRRAGAARTGAATSSSALHAKSYTADAAPSEVCAIDAPSPESAMDNIALPKAVAVDIPPQLEAISPDVPLSRPVNAYSSPASANPVESVKESGNNEALNA